MIRALEDHVAAEVHHARVLYRERNRCIPVKPILVAEHGVAHGANAVRVRVDRLLRTGADVGDIDHAALRVRVHHPRLCDVRHGKEPVATGHRVPVRLGDRAGEADARAAPIAVVLQAAAHHVRALHVVVDVIELRERHRVHDFPRLRAVEAHLPAAIRTRENPFRVERVDPHGLMVTVHVVRNRAEGAPAVLREVQRTRQRVHAIRILRVHPDVRVIEGTEIDVRITVHCAPRLAGVIRTPELAFTLGFGEHIHDVRIAWRHGQADAIDITLGQAALTILPREALPRFAPVHALVHRRVAAT